MKNNLFFLPLVFALLTTGISAQNSESLTEMRITSGLTKLLQKFLAPEEFIVNVAGEYGQSTNEKLVEKQVVREKPASTRANLPKQLPGFKLPQTSSSETLPAEYRKEVYRVSEMEVLNKVNVQIFVDEAYGFEELEKIQAAVNSYLANQLSVKYSLSFTPIAVKKILGGEEPSWYLLWWVWLLIALGILTLVSFLVWLVVSSISPKKNQAMAQASAPEDLTSTSALERTLKIDNISRQRALVMAKILANPTAFESFFRASTHESKAKILKLLSGPAMENILDVLHIDISEWPRDEIAVLPIDEAEAEAIVKGFSEFLSAYQWEALQFFGYLNHSDPHKLSAVFMECDPLSAAVAARFLAPAIFAKVLGILPKSKRVEILAKSADAALMPFSNVARIEKELRAKLESMPKVGEQLSKDEFEFLKEVFLNSSDQDKMLEDCKSANPEYFDRLAKLRFRLEDIPKIPVDIITKVAAKLDNREIAMALVGVSDEIIEAVLNQIPVARRSLIMSQMYTLTDAPKEERTKARLLLASEFRKERP